MNIGLDVDGVLTDFEWFLDFYAKKLFGKNFKVDVKQYKFSDRFFCTLKDERRFYIKYLWHYIRKVQIRENASAVIRALRSEGNKIFIITARALASSDRNPLSWIMRNILKKWLKRNGVEYDGIYFVSSLNSAKEKCDLADKLKLEYFIEDDPYNIRTIKQVTNVICINANYNLDIPNVQYALDFMDVYHIISTMDKMTILTFEERNKMSQDKRAEYFCNLKKYYSTVPSDKKLLDQFRKSYKKSAKFYDVILKKVFKYELIFENDAKLINNAIYICNHQHALDIPIVLCSLKNQEPRLLVKEELKDSTSGKILSKIGAIFVDRSSSISGKRAQNILIQTVLNGGSILIFPEGTRNRTEYLLLPFHYGALHIAQITGVPMVPMAMKRTNRRSFRIKVGCPILIDKGDILEPKKKEVQEIVMKLLG